MIDCVTLSYDCGVGERGQEGESQGAPENRGARGIVLPGMAWIASKHLLSAGKFVIIRPNSWLSACNVTISSCVHVSALQALIAHPRVRKARC